VIDVESLKIVFRDLYGSEPRTFRAPGRVNLIGEHTDYNDGFVLPIAIDRETVVAARVRDDRRVRAHSVNLSDAREFDLDAEGRARTGEWINYVEGVARVLESKGARLRGADLAIESDVPVGAGLSSSAALEVSVGLALVALSEADVDRVTIALAGQEAEHRYVGTRVGVMDQFIAALGRAGNALLIDCRSLETQHIPLALPDIAVVVCDTRVKHNLATSEYNTRRSECEHGVELLRSALPGIRALRDVSVEEFARHEELLPEPIRRRCRHVVTENARTLEAAEALRNGNAAEMGRLMVMSHRSLQHDYEVSCAELDLLVDVAIGTDGVVGARMTGGGFGGCTVNFVARGVVESFQSTVAREYRKVFGHDCATYVVEPSDGARELA
jgi:galactokinase